MKKLIFLFLLQKFLLADSFYNGDCIKDFYSYEANSVKYFSLSLSKGGILTFSSSSTVDFNLISNILAVNENKFIFNSSSGYCSSILKNNDFGINNELYLFLLGLFGLLLGNTIFLLFASSFTRR